MIIPLVKSKLYRFDYLPHLASSDISITTITEVVCGREPNEWWIGVRWRINGLDNAKEEIIGYLSETRTIIQKDGKKPSEDIPDLKSFIYNSFINVEMAFQEKLNLPYNVFGKPKDRPDFEKNAKNLSDQLIAAGYYN
jgi:hypothetical protein